MDRFLFCEPRGNLNHFIGHETEVFTSTGEAERIL